MFKNVYQGKKVLVTGATGFKGSWMCMWLLRLGAQVTGYSLDIPSSPSLFQSAGLEMKIKHIFGDVRDATEFESVLNDTRPDFVFHLAAQPIVSESFEHPVQTFNINVMGTVNILEALRKVNWPCVAILITSDKCYENVEWIWGYRENDKLGGKDIYSASKAAAEIAISSYYRSYFDEESSNVRLASVRAGNVIGGGDWAKDRIVVDCIKSWMNKKPVTIRSPNSTRPWQHVLEPLSGYLWLGATLIRSNKMSGECFNFGPSGSTEKTVQQLLEDLRQYWSNPQPQSASVVANKSVIKEATLLSLNCDKAYHLIRWAATLNYDECIEYVGKWYDMVCNGGVDSYSMSMKQIEEYEFSAKNREQVWALD